MNWFFALPLMVGTVTVLQGVLNRQMGSAMGLGSAILFNCIVSFVVSVVFYGVVRQFPDLLPQGFAGSLSFSKLAWWMILPGLFGFGIVAGIPWAISKLGAARVFVGIVVAQMVVSMAWDRVVGHKPLTWTRLLGVALAIVSVILVSLEREP